MSYKYALITFLGFLIILGLVSQHQKYREGLTGEADPISVKDATKPTDGDNADGPPSPGERPYEFDPKEAEKAAKSWQNKQDKKWGERRADAKRKALAKYNLNEDKLDDQRKAADEGRRVRDQTEFSFIADRQAKEKARIKKSNPPSPSTPPPPILPGVNPPPSGRKNSCDLFNCGDDYQRKSDSVTEEQVRAAVDADTNAEAAVAMYKKNADLAAAAALVGPSCTKIWAEEAAALYAAAVKKSAQMKIAVETIKKKAVFPAFCSGGECTKDECCELIPGREKKCPQGCGCSKCVIERGAVHAPDNTRVDTTTGPFVRNFFEGTEIFITPEGEPHAMSSGRNGGRRQRRNYSDYHKSYKDTVHHYPQESIRFDLLTPVPYSDAMAAPMGPGSRINPKLPKPALEQLSFRDRQINNID